MKIRINELARQLEVKSRQVIEKLAEFGVSEKLTHSSSIEDDMALRLRAYYSGEGDGETTKRSRSGGGRSAAVADAPEAGESPQDSAPARANDEARPSQPVAATP